MSIIHDYRLTHCSMRILEYLFSYRGMTALQLAQMYYEVEQPMATQKSNIHNYLSKLKKQGLVDSKKVNDALHPGSLYWLTPRGLDVTKELLNIEIGVAGAGYIFLNDSNYQSHADLPYDIYAPPRKQVEHHLLLIDFFNTLRRDFYEDDYISHRLSMYCSVEYPSRPKPAKIRPDAEIVLPGGDVYWIEIDRSTESHAQLMSKFYNYKHYFDYLKQNNLPLPMKAVLFVTDTKSQNHGLKRRWTSMLSAFLKVMHPYEADVRLLYTSLHDLEQTLRFEMQREQLKDVAKQLLKEKFQLQGYSNVLSYSRMANKSLFYALALRKSAYKIIYLNVSNTFDSSLYTNFNRFLKTENSIKKKSEVAGLQFEALERIIFYDDQPPFLLEALHGTTPNAEIKEELKELLTNLEFIKLD